MSIERSSYFMAIVTFSISVAIYEIFTNQIKCKMSDLENESHGKEWKKWDLFHFTGNDWIYIGDFFQNLFSTLQYKNM